MRTDACSRFFFSILCCCRCCFFFSCSFFIVCCFHRAEMDMTGGGARAEFELMGGCTRAGIGGTATTDCATAPFAATFVWVLQNTFHPLLKNSPDAPFFDSCCCSLLASVQAAQGGAGPCAIRSAAVPTRTLMPEAESLIVIAATLATTRGT